MTFGGINALSGVTTGVKKGEIFAIIGPNGAGKTCLLNCINRFYHPEQGRIIFEGQEITQVKAHKIAELGIARTFQNVELFGHMTVMDNIKLGPPCPSEIRFSLRRDLLRKDPPGRDGPAERDRGDDHRPPGD